MGIKYSVNENFFKNWSRKSAYVAGFIFADGHLENAPYIRGKYLRITSTDLSILMQIKKAIKSGHNFAITPASGNRKEKYLLRIGSHKIYDDLERIGVHPRKAHNMNLPIMRRKYLSDFIRGYFDGDGSIIIEEVKNGPYNRLKVIFTSGSKNFLLALSNSLKHCCKGDIAKVYDSHRSYQLVYRSICALNVLRFIYSSVGKNGSLYLDRKYYRYRQLIKTPNKIRCGNLFNRSSRIWACCTKNGDVPKWPKGGVCKTPIQRFKSARRLHK